MSKKMYTFVITVQEFTDLEPPTELNIKETLIDSGYDVHDVSDRTGDQSL